VALRGAEYARKYGLTRTCFTVRLLDQFTDSSLNGKANFLAGAIVATDLLAVKNSSAMDDCRTLPVVIGGSNIMAEIFGTLMHQDDYFHGDLIKVDSDIMKDKAGYGAILAARARGLCA
jgi:2-dehydro-3-deoxygalactonokinase